MSDNTYDISVIPIRTNMAFHRQVLDDIRGFTLVTTAAGHLVGKLSSPRVTRQKQAGQPDKNVSPIGICEIELSQPLPDSTVINAQSDQQYQYAQCLIRLHTRPLGMLELPLDMPEADTDVYAKLIWQALGEQINAHLREDGLPEVTTLAACGLPVLQTPECQQEHANFLQTAPFASIVLSTRDRPDRLARCLPTLLAQQYPAFEIIVVDNAPSTSATADLIQQVYADEPRIHYVLEGYPGLSSARNRGILEAQGEIIAFTDDDVVVDAHWLAGLAKGFSVTENVACVTSLVLPLALETPTQIWFEEFGGFNRGYVQRVFDRASRKNGTSLYPFTAGAFGTGAAMAFKANFLQEEMEFDIALGAGSPASGGEDLAAFFHVIMSGNRLVYEPTSLAYHEHRRDYSSFQKQMYDYGAGLTAYLTKILVDHPLLLFRLIILIPAALFYILSSRSAKNRQKSSQFPKELIRLERKGMLQGPFLYLKGRSQKK